MAIEIKKGLALLKGEVTIEEAEELFNYFLKTKKPRVDLSECEYLHTAVLQLLLVFQPELVKLPEKRELKELLTILKGGAPNE